ncbi:MAG: FHA domain-containing protein [Deltaproteobacteria bacterium]|jgi:hypothetical protein|nr:FHA domain-containing protein [Deltaproteobacteria bacterium]
MAMKLCENKLHWYNDNVNDVCPYCQKDAAGAPAAQGPGPKPLQESPAAPMGPSVVTNPLPSLATARGEGASPPPTQERGSLDPQILPVGGWLVITHGPGKGRDYRLIQGNNYVGRHPLMEISLDFGIASDFKVSRERHALVIFDIETSECYIDSHTESRNLPLLNGKTIRNPTVLKAYDTITVGETHLRFTPFVGPSFSWTKGSKA